MRRVQSAALDLFEARGFDAVTVDDIAAAAGVGPATVYRSFATKERIVLWDEYDPALFDALRARLEGHTIIEAVTAALAASLDEIYTRDRERILRRTRLLLSVPALVAASTADREAMRAALSALFLETRARRDALSADVAASAVVATLTTAVAHWAEGGGERPMREVLKKAFRALASLG